MWYVIQTSTGREEKIKQECEQRISKDVLSHCVLPLYEEKIKYKGQRHIQKKKLFPESTLQRIDRHKRKAWLNLEMFGRQQLVEVGVEIVKKVACET